MGKILEVSNLTFNYGIDNNNKIIEDLTFSVDENEVVAILSPNSEGKTTLIKILSGMEKKELGKIILNDIELSNKTFNSYHTKIGTVFENIDRQFICETVKDEIIYPLYNLNFNSAHINKRVSELAEFFGINNMLKKNSSELKMIDKIKVLLASSIAHNPDLLLIDDVFKYLNDNDRKKIFKLLKEISTKMHIAVLYTTSNINDAINASNIIVMSHGKKAMEGTFEEIIKSDNELSKMGIDIPLMIDLSRKLEFYNLVDKIYFDVDAVVDRLWN